MERGVATHPKAAKETLTAYAAQFMADRPQLAERTRELYEWLLDRYILPRFGDTAIGDIAPSSVRAWYARIAADHPTTAAKAYRLLRSISCNCGCRWVN
jgi:hypothetical protein